MLRGLCTLTLLAFFVTAPAWAQKPASKPTSPTLTAAVGKSSIRAQSDIGSMTTISPGELKATPEMWFYEQYMRQYQDPKMAVRANAEYRAIQRQHRLASMQWFGFSNSRPQATGDPQNTDYSPKWTSNNATYPYRWSGVGQTWYVAQPVAPTVTTR